MLFHIILQFLIKFIIVADVAPRAVEDSFSEQSGESDPNARLQSKSTKHVPVSGERFLCILLQFIS